MKLDDQAIKEILVRESFISAEDVAAAEKNALTHQTGFVAYLLEAGLITNRLLGQALAEALQVPYADLETTSPSQEQVRALPEDLAKKFRVVLFSFDQHRLTFTTDDPTQGQLIEELQKLFPKHAVTLAFSLPKDIDAALVSYQSALATRFSAIIANHAHVAPQLLEEIFGDALVYHASDIHFEPQSTEVIVRFRFDGVLHEAGRIPKEFYENILNRIKVQSGLRIDEHQTAQDGSTQFMKDGVTHDVRTSIVPTIAGEKVVLRVLSSYAQGLALSDLGLSTTLQTVLTESARKPFGMILVVGPTGSGKTTTLYAVLKMLHSSEVNITTIEDPVEYKMAGINQIQVKTQNGLTFGQGLRSIVRQDPDIILVGEIRDQETAEISVNAALTGHLLLSTFHANDASTAIPRLLDMGVEPFLLASTLEVIVAQRLARKICEHCRYSRSLTASDAAATYPSTTRPYFPESTMTLYQGRGCQNCGQTGFRGRTALFEIIRVTPAMKDLILHSPSSSEIWKLARQDGSRTLFEDGVDKVKTGITTLEELLRVAEPPRSK